MIRIAPLHEHKALCAFFARAFEAEWPTWYGPGMPGDAKADLDLFANHHGQLPVALIALDEAGSPLGIAALKASSIPSFDHLTPWATAGYVVPEMRGRGIGAKLLSALLEQAARLGHCTVYCATDTSASLLAREGWVHLCDAPHDGHTLSIYSARRAGPA